MNISALSPIMPSIYFILIISCIFFVSGEIVQDLFLLIHRLIPSQSMTYRIIALLFLPGTFIHELAHYCMAKLCLLKVVQFKVMPEWKHNHLRLGSVTYLRRDPIRGILVGVAPVILGIIVLEQFLRYIPFPTPSLGINIVIGYLIFIISSTMFSSKQDLVDFYRVLPFGLIIGIMLFFIKVDFSWLKITVLHVLPQGNPYIEAVNTALIKALVVQLGAFGLCKVCKIVIH